MPAPLLAASLGLQAIGMGASFLGARNAEKKAKQQAKADAELARHAAEVQTNTILDARTEAEKKAVQNMSVMARNAAIERGRILAGAGEAGVAGGSVSGSLLASYQHEAEARGEEIYNLNAYRKQTARELEAVQAGLSSNLPRYTGSSTSGYAALLSGAAEMLQTYRSMKPTSSKVS